MRSIRIILVPALLIGLFAAANGNKPALDVSRGTVKIIRTAIRPDYNLPWKMKDPETAVGSGAILHDKMILTNAHVVSDATYILVKKEIDPEMYEAEILFIAHDCDLALLRVNDRRFYENTETLELGGVPELRSKVTTYGYPVGGSRISITEGVTSRIEIGEYSHMGSVSFLMIQTDAAINPGNSGGPVMQNNRIVGVAFQASANSDNIGYMIPAPIIRHFLQDIRDGRYDGFPMLGVFTDPLENISYRRYLGMKDDQSGVLVTMVIPGGGAEKSLRAGDVIMSIDSVPVANDSTIRFMQGRIFYSYLIDLKQINEPVTLTVLRKGRVLKITYPLKSYPYRISWFNEYEKLPRYCIVGGIIFQPLSKEYLKTWNKWWHTADRRLLYYYACHISDNLYPERKEFILINRVLPDRANTYLSEVHDRVVDSINNVKITTLNDVAEAVRKPVNGYHVIRVDGTSCPLILKVSEIEEADRRIKEKYDIPSLMRLR
ncbi:MAG TPA: trypsin-like peptidase domain-containing protein [Spirochaetota bacterium]|nr:trypsin-like peptidase domain-containing protein [Spirochaetota bacterium]HPC42952.1 trypsin-like peptidase domain-containing protein [Spirochaetota bacterium]HPL18802.1 trypsin-like peptidase domain-containing protein [Spirochaetota bacterium]HQF07633.1 trypsin-like peptidase domain-containing protein [Spirochaetota bacterium]HQH96364.1 trypsin-like peptidase domain-containing protein [Spirochaetota bacterium]